MGSDYCMNPPKPVNHIVAKRVSLIVANTHAYDAMTHGWKVTITPDNLLQPEDGLWTVTVFKGEWL